MSFIKSCYGNIGKWRSTMFTWPPVVLFIYLQSFTTLPLTVKIVGEIVVPFELENAVSNYPPKNNSTHFLELLTKKKKKKKTFLQTNPKKIN